MASAHSQIDGWTRQKNRRVGHGGPLADSSQKRGTFFGSYKPAYTAAALGSATSDAGPPPGNGRYGFGVSRGMTGLVEDHGQQQQEEGEEEERVNDDADNFAHTDGATENYTYSYFSGGEEEDEEPPFAPSTPGKLGSRVKVAIRIRPPFEEEVSTGVVERNGDGRSFFPIVSCDLRAYQQEEETEENKSQSLKRLLFQLPDGYARDFFYDHCFGPDASQQNVYDDLAGHIVHGVLNGINGAIFAYGQTGTGKTYTMGILDEVSNENAGIIPRSLGHIFGHIASSQGQERVNPRWSVCMSFLQIYLEQTLDLLAPSPGSPDYGQPGTFPQGTNLPIREDPDTGFYVDGLSKFRVSSFEDATSLINAGLMNRIMAPTLMNATSSRSHTVLTIEVEEQDSESNGARFGKLVLVDLAGSERVRRTTSRGARLSEAKAINVSLSALGNVVAALASQRTSHVPFRDSKLTKLVQCCLGGNTNTALIATVGPALENNSETLSTLQFASRCLKVRVSPHVNEVMDYSELCARLQAKLASFEVNQRRREAEQQAKYEGLIRSMAARLSEVEHQRDHLVDEAAAVRQKISEESTPRGRLTANSVVEDDAEMYSSSVSLVKSMYNALSSAAILSATVLFECVRASDAADEKFKNDQEKRKKDESLAALERQRLSSEDKPELIQESLRFDEGTLRRALPSEAAEYVRKAIMLNSATNDQRKVGGEAARAIESFRGMGRSEFLQKLRNRPSGAELQQLHENEIELKIQGLKREVIVNLQAISALLKEKHEALDFAESLISKSRVEKLQYEEDVLHWTSILNALLAKTTALRSTNTELRAQVEAQQHTSNKSKITSPPPSSTINARKHITPPEQQLQVERVQQLKNYAEKERQRYNIMRSEKESQEAILRQKHRDKIEKRNDVGGAAVENSGEILKASPFSQVKKFVSRVTKPKSGTPSPTTDATQFSQLSRFENAHNEITGTVDRVPHDEPRVDKFEPKDLTADHICRAGGGGWLIRRRDDMDGKFEPMYFCLERGRLLSYRLLSMKGEFSLRGCKVLPHEGLGFDLSSADSRKYKNAFALAAPGGEASMLIISAPTEHAKQEWLNALRWATSMSARNNNNNNNAKTLKRRNSTVEMALEDVPFEGILTKRSTSGIVRRWQKRLFKLNASAGILEYFDISSHDNLDYTSCAARVTTVSVHSIAVEEHVNPIWFQNKCRYTFEISSGEGGDAFVVGTDSSDHRLAWLDALSPTSRGSGSQSWVSLVDQNTGEAYMYNTQTHLVKWAERGESRQ